MPCSECKAEFPIDHEPDCPKRPAVLGVKNAYCVCGGTGVRKVKDERGVWRGRYERCDCGRLVNSTGALKLSKQAEKDQRLEAIRKGAW